MTIRRSGARFYFTALMVAQLAAFARSVVLARLLGPEQMGLAAIVVVTAQFFDSITDTGTDRFLVQDRYGHSPESLQLVHLVGILKGALIAVLLIVLSGPIARFTGAPATAGALAALAIVPFTTGFTNYDFRAAQRHHRFGPEAKVMLLSELFGLVATTIAAFAVRNFTAVLYGLSVRALVSVAVSQYVASRPYHPRFSSKVAQRLWRFSAPLMLNGLLIFVATQSDRIIISRYVGLAELGRYTVVLLLGWYPSSMLMRFVAGIYFPLLAGARDDPQGMRRTADQLESGVILTAVTVAVGFAFVVPFLLPIVFGSKFAATSMLVTLVGLVTSWRMMKTAPATVAIAIGRTKIILLNNILRLSGIGCAIAGAYIVGGIRGVAAGLIIGEVIANVAASVMVARATGWRFSTSAVRYVFAIAAGLMLILRADVSDRHLISLSVGTSLACLALLAIGAWHEREILQRGATFLRQRLKFLTPSGIIPRRFL